MAQNQDVVLDIKESHSASDQLQFQDIAHDDPGDTPGAKVQTHNFTNFPDPDESDDDSQQANLIKGEKKPASFWTFDYYQSYFDVDTYQVLRRILGSITPNPRTNFLKQHIRPNPDLYGPFWICITLVFTTAIAGNMANYFQASGHNYEWTYDFHKVTFAATAIFGYWWVVPSLLYSVLWWRRSQAGYLFSEILCVYGYSLAIYIPISILWVIQIYWLQWLLVMVGMALSGSVLVFTFWPAVKPDDKKISLVTMAFIVIFHGALAVGFVLYFFHVPAQMAPIGNITTPSPDVHTNVTTTLLHSAQKDEQNPGTGDKAVGPESAAQRLLGADQESESIKPAAGPVSGPSSDHQGALAVGPPASGPQAGPPVGPPAPGKPPGNDGKLVPGGPVNTSATGPPVLPLLPPQ